MVESINVDQFESCEGLDILSYRIMLQHSIQPPVAFIVPQRRGILQPPFQHHTNELDLAIA